MKSSFIHSLPKGTYINDVRRFSTIFDPPSPPNVRFLPSNVRFFGVILDPPSPPKIGHHLCTFPYPNLPYRLWFSNLSVMYFWYQTFCEIIGIWANFWWGSHGIIMCPINNVWFNISSINMDKKAGKIYCWANPAFRRV